MADPILMYKGDNGVQDFYEDDRRRVVVLKCKGENWWSAHRFSPEGNPGYVGGAQTAKEAAALVGGQLSDAKVWKSDPKKNGFCLVPAVPVSAG